jgi:FkbM family methyltransferase
MPEIMNLHGLAWPAWDTKAEANYQYIQKHLVDMDYTISICESRDIAIQAGGHVGMWPLRLARFFKQVWTFEPEISLFHCMSENIKMVENVNCNQVALSDKPAELMLKRSGSSGSNRINEHGGELVHAIALDKFERCFNKSGLNVSAIFLDVEHHELQALMGGAETIAKYKPVIQCEQLDPNDGVLEYLAKFGYKPASKQGKDVVYQCRK